MELLFQFKVKLLKPLHMLHLAEMILVGSKYSVGVRSMKTNSCFWNAWKDVCTHHCTTATGLGKTPAIYSFIPTF